LQLPIVVSLCVGFLLAFSTRFQKFETKFIERYLTVAMQGFVGLSSSFSRVSSHPIDPGEGESNMTIMHLCRYWYGMLYN